MRINNKTCKIIDQRGSPQALFLRKEGLAVQSCNHAELGPGNPGHPKVNGRYFATSLSRMANGLGRRRFHHREASLDYWKARVIG